LFYITKVRGEDFMNRVKIYDDFDIFWTTIERKDGSSNKTIKVSGVYNS
jgi:hypothetical protein